MTDGDRGRLEATLHGRVQGVGFRYFVRQEAMRLGLTGWVSNEPNGSVRLVAEGPRPALRQLEGLLSDGPSGARVENLEVHWADARGGLQGFGVRSGGHSGD